jgi:predicted nucleic acid-binding protein
MVLVMSFENDKHPSPDRRDEIAVWETRSERSVGLSNKVEERARQIAKSGISSLDALHLASAEEGQADVVLTCDGVLVRRSRRLALTLRVLNSVAYFEEVKANG